MKASLKDIVLYSISLSILAVSTSLFGTVPTVIILLATVFLIINKDGFGSFHRRSMLYLWLFYVIVVVYAAFGRGALNTITLKMELFASITMFSVFFLSYHLKRINNDQIRFLLVVFLIAVSFSAIATSYVGMINPMALREYGFGEILDADIEEASQYHSMGMMSYSMAHAMSVVCMGLSALFCYSSNKPLKIVSLLLLVVIIRVLFIMTITTALMLTVIGVIFIFATFFSKGNVALSIVIVSLVVFVFFGLGYSSDFLDFSQDKNADITRKIGDAFSYVEIGAGGSQAAYRLELYNVSLRTFFRNPFLGMGIDNGSRKVIGDHSYLFDYLAYYGLSALLLFGAWWKEYTVLASSLSQRLKSCYYFSFIPVLGLFTLKARSVCSVLPFFSLVFLQIVYLYLNHEIKTPKAK